MVDPNRPVLAQTAADMIGGMTPVLLPDTYVFATTDVPARAARALPDAFATLREAEGMSLILPVEAAARLGFPSGPPMRCLTLNVYSSLTGVGLTAAVASALAERGVACNMVAGFHHDHAFVPADRAEEALSVLQDLQRQSTTTGL